MTRPQRKAHLLAWLLLAPAAAAVLIAGIMIRHERAILAESAPKSPSEARQ